MILPILSYEWSENLLILTIAWLIGLLSWRWKKFRIIGWIIIFGLNLFLNNLAGWNSGGISFDKERINVASPVYEQTLKRYQYDDLILPYFLRPIWYSKWMMSFLWIDSFSKYLSFNFWIMVLGYAGTLAVTIGFFESIKNKQWQLLGWWLAVVGSSSLGILMDSKRAIVLCWPILIVWIVNGSKKIWNEKWVWLLGLLLIIDLLVR